MEAWQSGPTQLLIDVELLMPYGVEQAWRTLSGMDPAEVCVNAGVTYDRSAGAYLVRSFLADFLVNPGQRTIHSDSTLGQFLLSELRDPFFLCALTYLTRAHDIPLSGEMVNPSRLPGGDIFLRGTHVLPLDKVAERFRGDVTSFFKVGERLGAEQLSYADASLKLLPLPRVPVFLLLWQGDDEFPANCTLLFDSTCTVHLPMDVLWSTASVTVQMMLKFC